MTRGTVAPRECGLLAYALREVRGCWARKDRYDRRCKDPPTCASDTQFLYGADLMEIERAANYERLVLKIIFDQSVMAQRRGR
jgi:hypothetical protein